MEITVPSSAKEQMLKSEAKKVIYLAQDVAEHRQIKFTYPVVRDKLYDTADLCYRVEQLTNHTVTRAYVSDGYITFKIKTV